jgi:hypothetical protein
MRIEEISNSVTDDKLPFDVVDDISIYMRNDPMFYRKVMFPAIMNMKGAHDRKEAMDAESIFGPMIHKAAHNYCKKFNINKRPDELLSDDDKKSLIQKLYSEEINNIKTGVY